MAKEDVVNIGNDLQDFMLDGYVILRDLLDAKTLDEALGEVFCYMPSWEEFVKTPAKFASLDAGGTSAGSARAGFPFEGNILNNIFSHPRIVAIVASIMDTTSISLEHSGITGKYAGIRDYDQELHVDYGNHTLAYPKDPINNKLWYDFGCIIYYTDVTIELGPTYVVSQRFTANEVLVPRHRSRGEFGWMYEHEVPVIVSAGSAVLYSIRTFHRGSAMLASTGARFSHHLGYRAAPYPYFDPRHFMRAGGSKAMDAFLEQASPAQRSMIGFPPPGDAYWDTEGIEGVRRRYPGMDMSPYDVVS